MEDSEQYEKEVLAIFILDDGSHKFIKRIDEDCFNYEKNRIIFKKINELLNEKSLINFITLKSKLHSTDIEKDARIIEYIVEITDNLVSTSNIEFDIDKLLELKLKRQLSKILTDMHTDLISSKKDIYEVKKELILKLNQIKEIRDLNVGQDISDIMTEVLEDIEKKHGVDEDMSLFTGIFELDTLTDGLHECELTCIGARPRSRKNSICFEYS